MAVAGMRHHQCLHGNGVLFHQVGDAGVRVDDDFIGQPLLTMLIEPFGFDELLTKRPVGIVNGHPDAGVSVHHLFRRNHFDLMGIGIQTVEFRHPVNFRQVGIKQLECPVGSIAQTCGVLIHGINSSH